MNNTKSSFACVLIHLKLKIKFIMFLEEIQPRKLLKFFNLPWLIITPFEGEIAFDLSCVRRRLSYLIKVSFVLFFYLWKIRLLDKMNAWTYSNSNQSHAFRRKKSGVSEFCFIFHAERNNITFPIYISKLK